MNYRKDPPIDISQLEKTEVPFDAAVESIAYYEEHVKNSKWPIAITDRRKRHDINELLLSEGLSHRGADYPDWRCFVFLDFKVPARHHLKTSLRWYKDSDWLFIENMIDENIRPLQDDNVITILARVRLGLEKIKLKEITVDIILLYAFTLLYCKGKLINKSRSFHDSVLPIYDNLYSFFLSKLNLYTLLLKKDSFWCIHSTLFLFPYEIGKLDFNTFEDEKSWLMSGLSILTYGLADE